MMQRSEIQGHVTRWHGSSSKSGLEEKMIHLVHHSKTTTSIATPIKPDATSPAQMARGKMFHLVREQKPVPCVTGEARCATMSPRDKNGPTAGKQSGRLLTKAFVAGDRGCDPLGCSSCRRDQVLPVLGLAI
jgi:hypothetical protein